MSFNKNSASSGSAASNASKASKHSNNKFAPLFKAENQIYNKTSPGPSPFLPKNFVKKAKASHVSGNASAGPSNNTMRRDDIVAARLAARPATPFRKKSISPPIRPSKPDIDVKLARDQARMIQANIDNLVSARDESSAAIRDLVKLRQDIQSAAGLAPRPVYTDRSDLGKMKFVAGTGWVKKGNMRNAEKAKEGGNPTMM